MCVCVGGGDNTIYINTLVQCINIIFVTVRMLCTFFLHITRVGIGMQLCKCHVGTCTFVSVNVEVSSGCVYAHDSWHCVHYSPYT